MKNISKILLAAFACASLASCTNFLGQNSISTVDNTFVFSSIETAKTVVYGAFNGIKESYNSGVPTNFSNIGSDVERCSVGIIADLVGASQLYGGPESYSVEKFPINGGLKGYWNTWYSAISKCNQVISNIQAFDNFKDILDNAPNEWSDLYGQAFALRATLYKELTHIYGDCIYYTENEIGQDIKELTNRDYILEKEIDALIAVEPLMFKVGENGHMPDQMTKNYVDGLIGRLCFQAAGYMTRRTDLGDDFYADAEGNKYSYEVWGTDDSRKAAYGRRSDWKNFYTKALPWLKKGVTETGEVALTTVDPRNDGVRTFGNPFQYYFEQVTQQVMPYESVFEIAIKEDGGSSRIAYNFGRGSNGGSPAYPPKANAQTCSYPKVFYDMFDPQDLRRDASVNVTGSTGGGAEALYNYSLSNKNTLGIGCNKYDLNRQVNPDARQLYSGINYIVMRQADIILMYAEALAVTGDAAGAKAELKKIHDRAFPAKVRDAKFDEFLAQNNGDVYEAIIAERALEFISENLRRWDLIRTGKLPEVAVTYRKALVDDIATMKKDGFVKYANGNEFPAYVWTKMVDAKKLLGYRLTAQTPEGLDPMSDEYAVCFPGWRGQHDSWETVAAEDGAGAKITAGDMTNVAILGLTKFIKEGTDEAKALEARGYKKTPWGSLQYEKADGTADAVTEARWGSEFLCGYSDTDYAAKKAPITLIPMEETVCTTTGLLNGYGFPSSTK